MPPAAACWRRKRSRRRAAAMAQATRATASRSRASLRRPSPCNRRRLEISVTESAECGDRRRPARRGLTMTDLVKVSDDDGVRTIRMNRADKKNALNTEMYAAMAQADRRRQSRARHPLPADRRRAGRVLRRQRSRRISRRPRRPAAGSAIRRSLSCMRWQAARSRSSPPCRASPSASAPPCCCIATMWSAAPMRNSPRRSSSLGLVPEAASSLLVPRLMGHRRAFALLVMGQPLDPQAAKDCGLVNEIARAGRRRQYRAERRAADRGAAAGSGAGLAPADARRQQGRDHAAASTTKPITFATGCNRRRRRRRSAAFFNRKK